MFERLTEKDREFIKNQVTMGYYASEIEVVRDAVRRLREKSQEEKLLELRALAFKGHEQLMRGESREFTSNDFDALLERAKENHQSRKPVKDEIKA